MVALPGTIRLAPGEQPPAGYVPVPSAGSLGYYEPAIVGVNVPDPAHRPAPRVFVPDSMSWGEFWGAVRDGLNQGARNVGAFVTEVPAFVAGFGEGVLSGGASFAQGVGERPLVSALRPNLDQPGPPRTWAG
jgi:hypothetical protein